MDTPITRIGEPLLRPPGERPASLVAMVHDSSVRYAGRPALQWREGTRRQATWRSVTYAELWAWIERVAIGLQAAGMRRGDRVAILSRSRPEWLVCDLASMSLGAITCPIFPGERGALVEYILRTTAARYAIVENAQQAAKVTAVRGRLTSLERVVVLDADHAPTDGTTLLEDMVTDTSPAPVAREAWDTGWRRLGRGDVATIVHTSGTTGEPKGVVLTHGNVLHCYEAGSQALPLGEHDLGLSVLPLSHMMERAAGMVVPLGVGACVAFAEPLIERWATDLLEVRPTLMVAVPPFFERFHKRVLAEVAKAPAWKRRAFTWALGLGRERYANHLAGRPDSPWLRLQLVIANRVVFAPIRARTGGRLRLFMSGAAPLPREIGEFFYAMGILILEAYGLTETGPVIAINRPESFKFGTVGPPFPETEIRIDPETGEILARGPQVMRGYLDKPQETAAAIDAQGWFHTGDIGQFDEASRLTITDRIKNLVVLSNGKKVSPGPMESALLASPYIAQAVILGEGQQQTGALVAPDFAEVAAWANERGVRAATPAEMAATADVQDLIEGEVRGRLREFAAYERPRRVALLPRELDDEHGELTALRKPKRHAVVANWPELIAQLFPAGGNGDGLTGR